MILKMHSISRIIRHGRTFGGSCHLSAESKEILSGRFLNSPTVIHRLLSSSKSDGENDRGGSEDKKDDSTKSAKTTKKGQANNARSSEAKAKLNSLLKSIVKDSKESAEKKTHGHESVVNMKLAIPEKQKKILPEDPRTPEEVQAEQELGAEMVQAVKKVAESVSDDSAAVESELVQKLKTQVGKKVNLSDLFAGMKIDRSSKAATTPSAVDIELSRAHRVRRLLDERGKGGASRSREESSPQTSRQRRSPPPSKATYVPIDLFGAPPLGIFDPVPRQETAPKTPKLNTWDALFAKDLKLSVTHPPANGFEEMILWTEQGKLWKFPIDNEQGLDEEAKVPFHEHVFLDSQLEGWCPKKGPIRHFMELVCSGLAKNPFLTVKEKHQQIEWYHQYFKEKSAILKEVGAGEIK